MAQNVQYTQQVFKFSWEDVIARLLYVEDKYAGREIPPQYEMSYRASSDNDYMYLSVRRYGPDATVKSGTWRELPDPQEVPERDLVKVATLGVKHPENPE